MATIPPKSQEEDHPATATNSSDSLKAAYETAIETYKKHSSLIRPTREEYDALFLKHEKAQKNYDKIIERESAHRTTYQTHKKSFGKLATALRVSQNKLRTTKGPIGDLQALTHATLYNEFRHASYTMMHLIEQNKHLEKIKVDFGKIDQEMYDKCHELFAKLDTQCKEMDQLHLKVVEAEEEMGEKPGCGLMGGKCLSCLRLGKQKARTREVVGTPISPIEAELVATAEKMMKAKGVSWEDLRNGLEMNEKLEDILEEEELTADGTGQ